MSLVAGVLYLVADDLKQAPEPVWLAEAEAEAVAEAEWRLAAELELDRIEHPSDR